MEQKDLESNVDSTSTVVNVVQTSQPAGAEASATCRDKHMTRSGTCYSGSLDGRRVAENVRSSSRGLANLGSQDRVKQLKRSITTSRTHIQSVIDKLSARISDNARLEEVRDIINRTDHSLQTYHINFQELVHLAGVDDSKYVTAQTKEKDALNNSWNRLKKKCGINNSVGDVVNKNVLGLRETILAQEFLVEPDVPKEGIDLQEKCSNYVQNVNFEEDISVCNESVASSLGSSKSHSSKRSRSSARSSASCTMERIIELRVKARKERVAAQVNAKLQGEIIKSDLEIAKKAAALEAGRRASNSAINFQKELLKVDLQQQERLLISETELKNQKREAENTKRRNSLEQERICNEKRLDLERIEEENRQQLEKIRYESEQAALEKTLVEQRIEKERTLTQIETEQERLNKEKEAELSAEESRRRLHEETVNRLISADNLNFEEAQWVRYYENTHGEVISTTTAELDQEADDFDTSIDNLVSDAISSINVPELFNESQPLDNITVLRNVGRADTDDEPKVVNVGYSLEPAVSISGPICSEMVNLDTNFLQDIGLTTQGISTSARLSSDVGLVQCVAGSNVATKISTSQRGSDVLNVHFNKKRDPEPLSVHKQASSLQNSNSSLITFFDDYHFNDSFEDLNVGISSASTPLMPVTTTTQHLQPRLHVHFDPNLDINSFNREPILKNRQESHTVNALEHVEDIVGSITKEMQRVQNDFLKIQAVNDGKYFELSNKFDHFIRSRLNVEPIPRANTITINDKPAKFNMDHLALEKDEQQAQPLRSIRQIVAGGDTQEPMVDRAIPKQIPNDKYGHLRYEENYLEACNYALHDEDDVLVQRTELLAESIQQTALTDTKMMQDHEREIWKDDPLARINQPEANPYLLYNRNPLKIEMDQYKSQDGAKFKEMLHPDKPEWIYAPVDSNDIPQRPPPSYFLQYEDKGEGFACHTGPYRAPEKAPVERFSEFQGGMIPSGNSAAGDNRNGGNPEQYRGDYDFNDGNSRSSCRGSGGSGPPDGGSGPPDGGDDGDWDDRRGHPNRERRYPNTGQDNSIQNPNQRYFGGGGIDSLTREYFERLHDRQTVWQPSDDEKFAGDPIEFINFKIEFVQNVAQKRYWSEDEKLQLLLKHLKGEAYTLVKPLRGTPDGYVRAWGLLSRRYGDPALIQRKCEHKIREHPKFPNNASGKDVRRYSDMIRSMVNCLQYIGAQEYLTLSSNVQNALWTLPDFIQNKWRPHAENIKRLKGRDPDLVQLSAFIEMHSDSMCNELFGVEAEHEIWGPAGKPMKSSASNFKQQPNQNRQMSMPLNRQSRYTNWSNGAAFRSNYYQPGRGGYSQPDFSRSVLPARIGNNRPSRGDNNMYNSSVPRGRGYNIGRQIQLRPVTTAITPGVVGDKNCIYCERVLNLPTARTHHVGRCMNLAKLDTVQRGNYLMSEGVCHRCTNKGHIMYQCPWNIWCDVCNGSHHTLLHGYDPKLYVRNMTSPGQTGQMGHVTSSGNAFSVRSTPTTQLITNTTNMIGSASAAGGPNMASRHYKVKYDSAESIHAERLCELNVTARNESAEIGRPNEEIANAGEEIEIQKSVDMIQASLKAISNFQEVQQTRLLQKIVPVRIKGVGQGDASLTTYALIDTGGSLTFSDTIVVKELKLQTEKTEISLTTITSNNQRTKVGQVSLIVDAIMPGYDYSTRINNVLVKDNVKFEKYKLNDEAREKYQHLRHIPEFIDVDIPAVTLIIGITTPAAHRHLNEVPGPRDIDPVAIETVFGWTALGPIYPSPGLSQYCTYLVHEEIHKTIPIELIQQLKDLQRGKDEILDNHMKEFWDVDMMDVDNIELGYSKEDLKSLEILKNTITFENGHYTIGMLWKDNERCLKNNKALAIQRLKGLKKRLSKRPEIEKLYVENLHEYLKNDHARILAGNDLIESPRTYYLPTHFVENANKPGEIRIVNDAAAEYSGMSLNKLLMQGPNIYNSIFGCLMRFRCHSICFMCDIKKMFHQLRTTDSDSDTMRILWFDGPIEDFPESGNLDDFTVMQMRVHAFGKKDSPCVATYGLKQAALDQREHFSIEVIRAILYGFYVDDGLNSQPTVEKALRVAMGIIKCLDNRGFNVTKFISNSVEFLSNLPKEKVIGLQDVPKDLDLDGVSSMLISSSRALGVKWIPSKDVFTYSTNKETYRLTKRGSLSLLSSVYDPIGFLTPFILKGKLLLREMWKAKLTWDAKLPKDIIKEWLLWKDDIIGLEQLQIPRPFFKTRDTDDIYSIHHFCDASEAGYGAVSYLRRQPLNGCVETALIMSKARVAPMKKVTIPRLELLAAVIAIRNARIIIKELPLVEDPCGVRHYYWSDSMVALQYIANNEHRFQVFVANRVQEIMGTSEVEQWHHCAGKDNPADFLSRGLTAKHLLAEDKWWNGPAFLKDCEETWTPPINEMHLNLPKDAEISYKGSLKGVSYWIAADDDGMESVKKLLTHSNSFTDTCRKLGWIRRLVDWRIKMMRGEKVKFSPLTVSEINSCARGIIGFEQRRKYCDEYETLAQDKLISGSSQLKSLCPKLVNGIMKIDSRIKNADIPIDHKEPIIIPKDSWIINSLIYDVHWKILHKGEDHTLAKLRETYWIVQARPRIRRLLKKCYVCRKRNAELLVQRMGDLPRERLVIGGLPFETCGVDYWGPVMCKRVRTTMKVYGVLFTCLSTRAVHLDIAESASTDAFLCAYRRFISTRGNVRLMYSDNGSNFIGANNELTQVVKDLNKHKLQSELAARNITWKNITPINPHAGGVWERMVRSTKEALAATIGNKTVTFDVLRTALAEIQYSINSRPLFQVTDNPSGITAITPNKILGVGGGIGLPLETPDPGDLSSRKAWRRSQECANEFWDMWQKFYLPTLHKRKINQFVTRNVRKGDLVLLKDDSNRRNHWNLARVCDVFPGNDGLVRTVELQTASGKLKRSIERCCLLEEELVEAVKKTSE